MQVGCEREREQIIRRDSQTYQNFPCLAGLLFALVAWSLAWRERERELATS